MVRSMREIPTMTDIEFFAKYGDVSRAIRYMKGRSDDLAEKIFSLYKRNGEQVQRAIKNAVEYYSEDFGKGHLPDRCLFGQLFGTKIPEEIISDASKKARRKKRRVSSQLSQREQEVFQLVRVRGLSQKQAAIEMQCSPQNVSQLLKKAEEKVKAQTFRSVSLEKAQQLPRDKRSQVSISEEDI